MPQRLLRLLPAALVVAGLLACVAGLLLQRMWLALPWPRLLDQLVMGALALTAAWPLRRWGRLSWAAGVWNVCSTLHWTNRSRQNCCALQRL